MINIFESFVELSQRELRESDKDALQIIFYYLVTLTISKTDDECVLNKSLLNDFVRQLQVLAQKDTVAKVIASACLLWITSANNSFQFYRDKIRNISAADSQNYFDHIKQQAEKGDPEAQTIMGIILCYRLMDQSDQPRGRADHLGFIQLPPAVKAETLRWLEQAVAQDYFYAHTIMFIYRYSEGGHGGVPTHLRVFSNRAMEVGDPYIYFVLGELSYCMWAWKHNGSSENQFEAPGIAWTAIDYFESMLGVRKESENSKSVPSKIRAIEHPNAQYKLAKMALNCNVSRSWLGKRTYQQGLENAFFWFSKAWKNGVEDARRGIEQFIFLKQASAITPKVLPLIYDPYPKLDTFARIAFCLYRDRQLFVQNRESEVHRPSRLSMLPYDLLRDILTQTLNMREKFDKEPLINMFFTVDNSDTTVTTLTRIGRRMLTDFEPKPLPLNAPSKDQPPKSQPLQVSNYPILFKFRSRPSATAPHPATAPQKLPVIEGSPKP